MSDSERLDVNPAAEAANEQYEPTPVRRDAHSEGSITRLLEQQTAKIPSHFFLTASLASMGAALFFYFRGSNDRSTLVGLWAPTLLTIGVYNKLLKLLGPR